MVIKMEFPVGSPARKMNPFAAFSLFCTVTPEQRRRKMVAQGWKMILLALLISLGSLSGAEAQKRITHDDLFKSRSFMQRQLPGLRSMNDGNHYTLMEEGSRIVKYSYQTGQKVATILDLKSIQEAPLSSFQSYELSNDETKILLTTAMEPIYRHSFTASYYVWNSVTGELVSLSEKGKQQLATFSPDGERVAFVRDNNLFIKNLKFGTESQVTTDGEKNKIINGAPDWVYEEEFGFSKAFAWSPDSRFLAFIRFDESRVREFTMTLFNTAGETPGKVEYPRAESFKYPRAGEGNSLVSVKVYDVRSRGTILADTGTESDIYLPRIKWAPYGANLVIMRMNRRQNQLDLLLTNPFTGDSRPLFTEKNEKFVDEDFLDKFTFLENGQFVVTSERDGFAHLYLHDKEGFEIKKLTSGNFDVTAFYGYDAVRKLFYYQAAAESPLRREVYFVSSDGKKKGKLSPVQGTNRADFSNNFNYYIHYHTNVSTPAVITLHDYKGKQIRVLEDNEALKKRLAEYALPQKEFFTFTTPEGISLNGWMIRPSGFEATRKYPVVMTQYSGPNSQQVTDSWSVGWNEYLAQEGFAVVCVDPRGTGARGEEFRKVTYMQLGRYESDDMVSAARYLGTLPWIDPARISIWGWSYGGFMTALTMAKGGELFRAGIAVAPVTNWRFYDNIYTERYMRTPEENPQGYDDNSPVTHAGKIKGRLLLVHGSADDNVHVQNSMTFAEALVQGGVPFDMAIYTDKNHGIRGGNTTMHLYAKMEEFLRMQLLF